MNRDNGGVVAGANLPALRSHNAALVLDLLRTAGEGGISRLELAERTGLTPQAVSKITARLRAEGLAADAGRRASTGGKPATVLRLVPAAAYAVGLHLDRDELTAVLLDLAGARVAVRRVPLDLGAGAEAVLAVATAEVAALTAPWPPAGAAPAPPPAPGTTSGPASASSSAPASASPAAPAPSSAPAPAVASSSIPASSSAPAPASAPDTDVAAPHLPAPHLPAPASAVSPTSVSASAATCSPAASVSASASSTAPAPASDAAPLSCVAPENAPMPVLGVGVAMPGPLDHRSGVPGRVTGFPEWDGFPLREELARRLGLPVVLDKDTNAAALGLALRPDAPDSFAYVHLGTGLGAGLVLGGAVLRGDRTGAGELGHQTVQLDGPPCDCGGRGCLEVLCLTALARGDRAEAARILGTGAANLVRLLDIDRVLLGGRAVLADPEAYVRGAREVLAGLGLPADVGVADAPYAVAEGAARLILAPIFGK